MFYRNYDYHLNAWLVLIIYNVRQNSKRGLWFDLDIRVAYIISFRILCIFLDFSLNYSKHLIYTNLIKRFLYLLISETIVYNSSVLFEDTTERKNTKKKKLFDIVKRKRRRDVIN